MSYTMLNNDLIKKHDYAPYSLEDAALSFIREYCEGLRFDKSKAVSISFDKGKAIPILSDNLDFDGTSLKANQIPFNMEKDIDRLCLENAVDRFLKSGKKEDAFDVYFCYLEMFVGDYRKTRRMIELLSEYEANGSGLLMKHRDHYSHSVYVFILGMAIYQSNEIFRKEYRKYYGIDDEKDAAAHYLQYWGLCSLFHDIGYPFELPFEQVCSYFAVEEDKEDSTDNRKKRPFMAYQDLEKFITIEKNSKVKAALSKIYPGKNFYTTDDVFAYILHKKMGEAYGFSEKDMRIILTEKPTQPNKFNHRLDHAYFSATILFRKLFEEMDIEMHSEHLDALTAILMHNSLYKYCIAHYDSEGNKPFKPELHPLAYMLMLCDELQCWDRTAYGRNSKKELHPMGCTFDFSRNDINAIYLFDEREMAKINQFKDEYIKWLQDSEQKKSPELKAYSGMYLRKNGVSGFQEDIERIVDLTEIHLKVETGIAEHIHTGNRSYLSDSNFINLYNFAIVLNGRWSNDGWKRAKLAGREEQYLIDSKVVDEFTESFKNLSLEYKLSNINQAKAFAKYMNMIGCFYHDKEVDFEQVETFTDEELVKIGKEEHHRWLQEHYDMGWTYGTPEEKSNRDFVRKHKDMIPGFKGFTVPEEAAQQNYERLDKATQDKDKDPMECMLVMLKMFGGLRIYRL